MPGGDGFTTTALPTASAGATFWIEQIDRPVERRNRGDDAVGNAHRETEAPGAGRRHIERQHLAHEVRQLRGAGADEGAGALGLEGRGAPRLADDADERANEFGLDLVHGVGRRQQPFDAFRRRRVLVRQIRLVGVLHRGIDDAGIGFDHVRGDALVDRRHQRRKGRAGGDARRAADPGQKTRDIVHGNKTSSSIFGTPVGVLCFFANPMASRSVAAFRRLGKPTDDRYKFTGHAVSIGSIDQLENSDVEGDLRERTPPRTCHRRCSPSPTR